MNRAKPEIGDKIYVTNPLSFYARCIGKIVAIDGDKIEADVGCPWCTGHFNRNEYLILGKDTY